MALDTSDWALPQHLPKIPTADLVNELAKRKGVVSVVVPSSGRVEVAAEDFDKPKPTKSGYISHYFFDEIFNGPTRILVVS